MYSARLVFLNRYHRRRPLLYSEILIVPLADLLACCFGNPILIPNCKVNNTGYPTYRNDESRYQSDSHLSGRQDSNLRPPGPKPGALPACATSRIFFRGQSKKERVYFISFANKAMQSSGVEP